MTGYHVAHGYSDSDGFSGRAGVPGEQSPNEFYGVQASRPKGSVSPQSELVHHDNSEDASSATSFNEEIMQSNLHPGYRADEIQGVPAASSVQKADDSGNQHPFELLLRDSENSNHVEGVSFPTIKDFNQFVEILKSSYLMPGGDLTKHFQTAREMIQGEARAQYAQAELDAAAVQRAAAESASEEGGRENEVHSEPYIAAPFEDIEQGGKYQTASKGASVSDPVDSASNLISPTLNVKEHLGPPLSSHVVPRSAGSDKNLFSREKPIFINGPKMQKEDERNDHGDRIGAVASKDARSKPSNSYGRSIQVKAPQRLFNFSILPKSHSDRPSPTSRLRQSANVKKFKEVIVTPTGHLQLPEQSVSSNPSPQSTKSPGDAQSSSPQNSQREVLNRGQPIGSHDTTNARRTNNRDGNLGKLPPQNLDPTNQESRVSISNTPNTVGRHSPETQMGERAILNTLPYFASPLSSQAAFSRLFGNSAMFRNFGFKSTNPNRNPTPGATRNMMLSFLNQQRAGLPLKHASVSGIHAGALQNFMKQSKLWNHPHNWSQRFGNMAYSSPGLWSASKFLNSAPSGRIWPNGGKNRLLFPMSGHRASASPENLSGWRRTSAGEARRNRSGPLETYFKAKLQESTIPNSDDLNDRRRANQPFSGM